MDSNGRITITDRQKDMILVSGFNVYPNEIESVLQGMPVCLNAELSAYQAKNPVKWSRLLIVKQDPSLTKEQVMLTAVRI